MRELETTYAKLKEEWINQRLKEVEKKLKEIEDESAEEFTIPLKKLQMNMEKKTNNSSRFELSFIFKISYFNVIKLFPKALIKDYRLKNIEHVYECEIESNKRSLEVIIQDRFYFLLLNNFLFFFKNNMNSLIEKYKTKIQSEIEHLEESRRQFLLEYDLYKLNQNEEDEENDEANSAAAATTSTKKRKKNSPVLLTGTPYVVYTLPENEILEDLSLIKMHNNLSKIFNNSES